MDLLLILGVKNKISISLLGANSSLPYPPTATKLIDDWILIFNSFKHSKKTILNILSINKDCPLTHFSPLLSFLNSFSNFITISLIVFIVSLENWVSPR